MTIGREAAIPNPALETLAALVGRWDTVGRHPLMPGVVLHGRVEFDWLEGGAFLLMRTEMDEPGIPSGLAIFASDDAAHRLFMLYFDERGVSRKYDVTFSDGVLRWSRDEAGFAQRFAITIASDARSMAGRGEMSRNGARWEGDLELEYRRAAS